MEQKYEKHLKKQEDVLNKLTKTFNMLGYLKLITLLILIGSGIYSFYPIFRLSFLVSAIVFLILLVFLSILHNNADQKIQYRKGIILIDKKYIDRINGKWIDFEDMGYEFINSEHPYSLDLDIVGKKSLFQLLNSTSTYHGRQAFAHDLLLNDYPINEIAERQKAIEELTSSIEFSHDFQYYASKIKPNEKITLILKEIKNTELFMKSKPLRYILKYCPLFITPFSIVVYIFQFKSLFLIAFILLAIQALIWSLGYLKIKMYFIGIDNLGYTLVNYSKVFTLLQTQSFKSDKLNSIKNNLTLADYSASSALRELNGIISRIDVKSNPIVYFVLNVLLLWDYECAFKLEQWKMKYSAVSESWFTSLGEFESLLSFSNVSNVIKDTCFPEIDKESRTIKSIGIGHPLISNDNRVCNDFIINNEIIIISGSNMSGKTTFLRTLGINIILARNGCNVCAKQMSLPLLEVITSMRIADDLNEGVSTFYAELKRIKRILELSKSKQNVIFLIDEIFKGTNSVDRLLGAKAVIKKLNAYKVMGLITTHDLELCKLSSIQGILNYNFTESYIDKNILFDYKIKEGEAKTTNAKFLMQAVGILNE